MKAAAVGPPGQDSRDHLKLPRIVWTNLVFQVPRSKIPPEVTTRKTRRQEGNLTATSKHSFRSEGGIIKRKNREGILLPLWTGGSQPTASSPDFQLPTHLLLQKLQETTTSSNHLLIAKVLRSLREELLRSHACESDQREEQENFVELSRIQSWKQGKRAKGEKAFDVTDRETAKNRLIRLIGNRNSFPQDTGVL
ncbi:uncharacterized protein [Erythrolamprus reginae]|uniref:uncharacterized protein isoform X4 n=1 Tax=Erythrolamprus reginae TaxID=121349 RepID=UPI00396CB321